MEKRKIIIIGSGPAGISTALSLKNLAPGLADELLILEKDQHPRHKLCGGGVTVFADKVLQKLGLKSTVPFFPIHKVTFLLDEKTITFPCENLLRIIRRDEFDAELTAQAKSAGVAIIENTPVKNLRREQNGIVLETPTQTYQAQVVVGADGANSLVRRKLVRETTSRVSRLMEVVYPVSRDTTEVRDRIAVFDFRHLKPSGLQGYLWDFPTLINGQFFLNTGIFDSRIRAGARPDLRDLLTQRLAQRGLDHAACEIHGHPERWYHPDGAYAAPNVILVGDAAGVEPWLGEGISMALGYGPVAAQALAEAFDTKDFEFRNYERQLRRSSVGKMLARNRRIARYYYSRQARPIFTWLIQSLTFVMKMKVAKYNKRVQQAAVGAHQEKRFDSAGAWSPKETANE